MKNYIGSKGDRVDLCYKIVLPCVNFCFYCVPRYLVGQRLVNYERKSGKPGTSTTPPQSSQE